MSYNILLAITIGLSISCLFVFEIWYFSARHWDENGEIKHGVKD